MLDVLTCVTHPSRRSLEHAVAWPSAGYHARFLARSGGAGSSAANAGVHDVTQNGVDEMRLDQPRERASAVHEPRLFSEAFVVPKPLRREQGGTRAPLSLTCRTARLGSLLSSAAAIAKSLPGLFGCGFAYGIHQ